jgi:hypothetical protein
MNFEWNPQLVGFCLAFRSKSNEKKNILEGSCPMINAYRLSRSDYTDLTVTLPSKTSEIFIRQFFTQFVYIALILDSYRCNNLRTCAVTKASPGAHDSRKCIFSVAKKAHANYEN